MRAAGLLPTQRATGQTREQECLEVTTHVGERPRGAGPGGKWRTSPTSPTFPALQCSPGQVMSAIKRDRGVKDWGWMIEGHGGVLDRLDSVTLAAPVFFHTIRYFWSV